MSTTETHGWKAGLAVFGGLADMLGGIATAILAIAALAAFEPGLLLGIATVVYGATLLVQGMTLLSEYSRVNFPSAQAASLMAAAQPLAGDGLVLLFLVGAAGIVLGILALLGLAPSILTASALVAFGTGLAFSSAAIRQLHRLQRAAAAGDEREPEREFLADLMAAGSAGAQSLAGVAAIVLATLVLNGLYSSVLTLVALLIAGISTVLSGSALLGAPSRLVRPRSGRSASTSIASHGS